MAETSDAKLHIVMVPWLAFGHMIPYLELAKQMIGKGHRVTFVSTPRNIDRLPKIPQNLAAGIDFVKIPLPAVDSLPENAEATSDLTYDKVQYLKLAYDLLSEPVARLLKTLLPDWVFYDFAPYWIGPIARKLRIKAAQFIIFTASTLVFIGPPSISRGADYRKRPEDYTVAPNWVPFKSRVAFSYYSIKKVFDVVEENASGMSDLSRFGAGQDGADIIVVRSSYEVEPEWLNLFEELLKKPVIPSGHLPPNDEHNDVEEESEPWLQIKQWLDTQRKGSVVYVAFGSEAKPTQDELTNIASGLEMSGLPFFWVLKTQLGSSDKDRVELPDGFMEKIKDRGIIWTSWAPQLKVLSHDSVGGFLTHCGCSSIVEGMSFGKPLIMFPLLSDQSLNAHFLEEKKMGHPILRNELDGSFTSESVSESLRLVMVEEEGKAYREKAMEMKPVFGNMELQDRYTDNLLAYMISNRPLEKPNALIEDQAA